MSLSHERVVVVHNKRSSRAARVQAGVFDRLTALGLRYEDVLTPSRHAHENSEAIAERLRPGDTVISAGGDGTAHASMNAIALAGSTDKRLAFFAGGNINDGAHTHTSEAALHDVGRLLMHGVEKPIYPLDMYVNGELLERKVLLYASMGSLATLAGRLDDPALRAAVQRSRLKLVTTARDVLPRYIAGRGQRHLPPLALNGGPLQDDVTDVLAVNNPRMARFIRSDWPIHEAQAFMVTTLNTSHLGSTALFAARSLVGRMPGERMSESLVRFAEPASIPLQVDGEALPLEAVTSLRVVSSELPISVVSDRV